MEPGINVEVETLSKSRSNGADGVSGVGSHSPADIRVETENISRRYMIRRESRDGEFGYGRK